MSEGSPQSRGDIVRAEVLTPERRAEIARNAAKRRWDGAEEQGVEQLEPKTIGHLADAMSSLLAAKKVTRHGFVDDHCANALNEIKKALAIYSGSATE